jgi:hypothetical protein
MLRIQGVETGMFECIHRSSPSPITRAGWEGEGARSTALFLLLPFLPRSGLVQLCIQADRGSGHSLKPLLGWPRRLNAALGFTRK